MSDSSIDYNWNPQPPYVPMVPDKEYFEYWAHILTTPYPFPDSLGALQIEMNEYGYANPHWIPETSQFTAEVWMYSTTDPDITIDPKTQLASESPITKY